MGTQLTRSSNYRPDIEGLRGLAVALVVAFHASPRRMSGGFIGVDVFFVISGYLITGLLLREIEETGRLSFAGFYARRARRLLPASALVFLATLLACSIFLSPLQQFKLGDSGTYVALYASNFWFLHQATNYFAPTIATNPFLHTWSLAVEEQFYLVWPAIVLLGMRGLRSRKGLLALMVVITAGSFAASIWYSTRIAPLAFFSPFTRAWEFSIGGVSLLLAPQEARIPQVVRTLLSWLGVAAILGASVMLHDQIGWRGWHGLIPVLGTVAILHGCTPQFSVARFLDLRFMQYLGRISYVWYLWHWPVFAVFAAASGVLTFTQRAHMILYCVLGSLALAAITHVLVEDPIRFSRFLGRHRALTLAGVGLVTLLTAGTAALWQHSAVEAANSLQGGKILAALGDPTKATTSCPGVGFLGSDLAECIGGDANSKYTVVLFGDSHARMWFGAFAAVGSERSWRIDLIRKPACPTADITVSNPMQNRAYTECDIWRAAAMQRILELHPTAVVISNRQLQTFVPGIHGPNETWREASRKTLKKLDDAGITTILLRDTPTPGVDIPDCLNGDSSWWARHHSTEKNPCMLYRSSALNEGVFQAEKDAASGLSHVHILDLTDLFCDGAVCPPIKDGMIVYSDDNHISEAFSLTLAPQLSARLAPLVPDHQAH
jgi:peptidoglycan/LPS O-acetylase OafA/YrhL